MVAKMLLDCCTWIIFLPAVKKSQSFKIRVDLPGVACCLLPLTKLRDVHLKKELRRVYNNAQSGWLAAPIHVGAQIFVLCRAEQYYHYVVVRIEGRKEFFNACVYDSYVVET